MNMSAADTTSSMMAMKTGPTTQPKIAHEPRLLARLSVWRCSGDIWSARPDSSIWFFMNSVGSTLLIQTPVKPSTIST